MRLDVARHFKQRRFEPDDGRVRNFERVPASVNLDTCPPQFHDVVKVIVERDLASLQSFEPIAPVGGCQNDAVATIASEKQHNGLSSSMRMRRKAIRFKVFKSVLNLASKQSDLKSLHAKRCVNDAHNAARCHVRDAP